MNKRFEDGIDPKDLNDVLKDIKLTEESLLVWKHIATTFNPRKVYAAEYAAEIMSDVLNKYFDIMSLAYAGYEGVPGECIDPDDVLDVFSQQCKDMLDLVRKYSPFV